MDGNGGRQSLQIIAAFENRYNAPLGMGICGTHEFQSCPGEVFLTKLQASQGIGMVGVKACGDQHKVRRKIVQGRKNDGAHGIPELRASITSPQRGIENVADPGFTGSPGTRIKRHLVCGTIEQVWV